MQASLGMHVAGCVGSAIKSRNRLKVKDSIAYLQVSCSYFGANCK
jgi:hypothetical protein